MIKELLILVLLFIIDYISQMFIEKKVKYSLKEGIINISKAIIVSSIIVFVIVMLLVIANGGFGG